MGRLGDEGVPISEVARGQGEAKARLFATLASHALALVPVQEGTGRLFCGRFHLSPSKTRR